MRTTKNIFSYAVYTCLLLVSINSNASTVVTGTLETKKASEKYSLKNLSAHKTAGFASLKSNLEFKGFANTSIIASGNSANYLKYNKGNVSYVIPYHYKVILSKFKTPSAQ